MCHYAAQTMLFSATMSASVKTLVSLSLNNPAEVRTEALYSTAGGLRQQFVRLKKGQDTPLSREAVLLALCSRSFKTKTIGNPASKLAILHLHAERLVHTSALRILCSCRAMY